MCKSISTSISIQLKVVEASKAPVQRLVVELELTEEHLNNKGGLHGGFVVSVISKYHLSMTMNLCVFRFTASITDMVTARAVGMTIRGVPMVSISLSVRFLISYYFI